MLRPNTTALTALLALLVAIGPLATDIYIPSMPEIGRLLAASFGEVQLTLSAFLIGFAIGQLVYGPISDRYGRKPVLLATLVVFSAASAACAVAPNIETLIVVRGLQALGGSGAVVIARAIVRDLYAGARAGRELSLMGAIMSFAPVVAPLVGGIVQIGFGWRANFIIVVGIGVVATVIVWWALPETRHPRTVQAISIAQLSRNYRKLLENRVFLAHLGIVSASFAGLFAWISGSPFFLQGFFGLSAFEFSIAFALACIGSLIGTAVAAPLVMRLGLDLTIGLGTLCLAAGGLAMVGAIALGSESIIWVILSMALYLAGHGLASPQAMAGAMTPFPDRAGAAASLIGFVQQTSAAALGAFVGYALGNSGWSLAVAIATMGCVSLALWAGSRHVCAKARIAELAERYRERNKMSCAAFEPNWLGESHATASAPAADRSLARAPDSPLQGFRNAALLTQRIKSLRLDPDEFAHTEPRMFRQLAMRCSGCESTAQCANDLAREPAGTGWRDYCPNSPMLGMIGALRNCVLDAPRR